ncbi:MAG: hypothetical protein HYY67_07325 [Thaumarchaeota archaeon]|nr:hypothetical protein [Nitrososphaerota archaeon]
MGKEKWKIVSWEREKKIRKSNGKTYVYRYRITEESLGLIRIEENEKGRLGKSTHPL